MHINHLQTPNTQQQLPVSLLISGKSGFSRRSNMLILKPIKQWNPEIPEINFVEKRSKSKEKISFSSQLKIGMCHCFVDNFKIFLSQLMLGSIFTIQTFLWPWYCWTFDLHWHHFPVSRIFLWSVNTSFFSSAMTPIRI